MVLENVMRWITRWDLIKSHLIIVRQFILRVIVPINKIGLNTGLRRALFSMDRNYVRK